MEKLLIINADDLGFSADINAAIEELHRAGIITNSTLMVEGPHVADALKIIRRNPRLGVGLHLDLCPVAGLYRLPYQQMREDLQKPDALARVAGEVERQIKLFKEFGLQFQHMDGHRHFHALPELFATVVEVAGAHGLKTTRFTKDWILPRTPSVYLDEAFFSQAAGLLDRYGIAYVRKFIYGWKDYSAADVAAGWNELMVHVGYDDEHYLREYKQLAAAGFAEALRSADVTLRSYPEMAQARTACASGTEN